MFTRQHYEAIAKAVSRLPNNQDKAMLISDLVNLCEADNPQFDGNRFANACYKPSIPEPDWDAVRLACDAVYRGLEDDTLKVALGTDTIR